MIDITAEEWTGLDGLGEEALREIRPQAERTVLKAELLLEKTVKETLKGKRSGRTYKVSKTGALHVSSAPGEPPATLFGNLSQSVGHSEPEWKGWTVEGRVGPGLGQSPTDGSPDPGKAYARRLEYGGADSRGVMIEPRPYMEPSARKAEPGMDRIFREGVGSR